MKTVKQAPSQRAGPLKPKPPLAKPKAQKAHKAEHIENPADIDNDGVADEAERAAQLGRIQRETQEGIVETFKVRVQRMTRKEG